MLINIYSGVLTQSTPFFISDHSDMNIQYILIIHYQVISFD